MTVSITVDLSGLEQMLPAQNLGRARGIVTSEVGNDSNVYCPRDTGMLQDTMDIDAARGTVAWVMPYAAPRYVMPDSSTRSPRNSKGASRWFEVAKDAHLDEWEETAARALIGEV